MYKVLLIVALGLDEIVEIFCTHPILICLRLFENSMFTLFIPKTLNKNRIYLSLF